MLGYIVICIMSRINKVFWTTLFLVSLTDISDSITNTEARVEITVPGNNVLLTCSISHIPSWRNVLVLWQRSTGASSGTQILSASREILLPQQNRIFIDGEGGVYNLVIQNVVTDDEGQYTCQIPSSTEDNVVINLIVNVPATIRAFYPTDDRIDVELGERRRFECVANGKPQPTIVWSKVAWDGLTTIQRTDDMSVLEFNISSWRDSGIYTCTADNGAGNAASHNFNVNVLYRPVVKLNRGRILVGLGSLVTVDCTIKANPIADVSWYHNGTNIFSNDNFVISTNLGSSTLTIKSIEFSDVGIFRCRAENRFGEASDDVIVTGEPYDLTITSQAEGEYRNQFTLEWIVYSLSPLEKTELQFSLVAVEPGAPGFDEVKDTIHVDDSRDNEIITIIPVDSQFMHSHYTQRYLFEGLLPGRQYDVAVRAKNLFSFSPWTDSFIFQTSLENPVNTFSTTESFLLSDESPSHHYLPNAQPYNASCGSIVLSQLILLTCLISVML